jgi:hypothetical protein
VTTYTEAQLATATVSGGTELEHELLGGGSGPHALGGASRGEEEWILKPNTIYLVYVQNIGANANTHVISLNWYESDPTDLTTYYGSL